MEAGLLVKLMKLFFGDPSTGFSLGVSGPPDLAGLRAHLDVGYSLDPDLFGLSFLSFFMENH